MTVIGGVLVMAGAVLLVIAALGLFLLPDALARQHAATKAGTLAVGMTLTGIAVLGATSGWWWRAAAILLILVVTLPVSSHMLARAAARELLEPDTDPEATGEA